MALNLVLKKTFTGQKWLTTTLVALSAALLLAVGYSSYLYMQNLALKTTASKNTTTIQEINKELADIKSTDPYKTNTELKKQIDNIQRTFAKAVVVYENLLDLENPPKEIKGLLKKK